jgi:hypothetical protein
MVLAEEEPMVRRLEVCIALALLMFVAAPAFAQTDFSKAQYFPKATPGQKKGQISQGNIALQHKPERDSIPK